METVNFLKEDIRGLIILGIVSSLIAILIYDISKKLFKRLKKYWKIKMSRKFLTRILTSYLDGYATRNANESSYQQIVLTGNYIIRFVIHIGVILFSIIIFVASLILIGQQFFWIIIIIFSAILTFQYRKLMDYKKDYEMYMRMVFGEEFYEDAEKSMMEFIDNELKD